MKKHKLLAVFLALVLTLTLLPTAALAEDTEATTAEALQNALNAGGEVNLTANVTGDFKIPEGKEVTLNIAEGVTMTSNSGVTLTNEGILTLTGSGTIINTASYAIENRGTMTINGNISVTDGYEAKASLLRNGWDSAEAAGGKTASLTVNSGKFTGGMNTFKNDAGGELSLNGGTISFANKTSGTYAVMNWSKLTIPDSSTVQISAFWTTSKGSKQALSAVGNMAGGNTSIAGGSLDGKVILAKGSKMVVEGGTIVGSFSAETGAGDDVLEYCGGKITGTVYAKYLAPGIDYIKDESMYVYGPVLQADANFKAGEYYYIHCGNAAHKLAEDATLFQLNSMADEALNYTFTANSFAIDLGGCTWRKNSTGYTARISANKTVTLTGNGAIEQLNDSGKAIQVDAGAKLIIKNGTYTGKLALGNSSTVTIEGGSFSTPLDQWTFGTDAVLSITGGTFSADPTEYVADGYIATEVDGNYTVRQRIPSELTTNIGETHFVVGVPTEFTYTTMANDDANKRVIGTSNFSDTEAIEKLEYYEVQDGNWYVLNGDFGSSAGFPMSDATSRFRVTFKTAGSYTFTSFMKLAGSDTVLCSTEVSFTVSDPTMQVDFRVTPANATIVVKDAQGNEIAANQYGGYDLLIGETYTYTVSASGYNTQTGSFVPSITAAGGNLVTVDLVRQSSGGSSSSGSSNTTTSTTTNKDGSTTTTTTNKTTGTVTEVTKETDGTTTTVETKKDGTVTETVKTPEGTTGTVVTDKNGDVTEVKSTVSSTAAKEAAKTGEAVTLPVEVPAAASTEDAPAVQVSVPKSAGSVKVEIPVEKVTPGTVAVIVNADGTEKIVSTSVVTEDGVALTLNGNATVKVIDNSKDFVDVPESNVFYNEISSLSAREIMVGKTDDTFDLNSSVTLNQIANVAGRITGAVDVKDFNAGIVWGAENGLKTGSEAATRGEVLKALYVAAGSPAVMDTAILGIFNDSANIPADMAAIVAWAAQNGILKGTADGNANLGVNVTRGQACALAGRAMGALA